MQAHEIEEVVLRELAQVLERAPSDVDPKASLLVELGAESLDLLDLSFRLEKHFMIALPRANLLQHAEEVFGPRALAEDGKLTDLGLRVLAAMRPEIEPARFVPGLRAIDVAQHLTPETFVRVIQQLLESKRAFLATEPGCAACGSRAFAESTFAPELVCKSCQAVLPLPSGDQILLEQLKTLHARYAEA